MDEDELDKTLTDIHVRTERMDERTEHILTRLDKLHEGHQKQGNEIDELANRVDRHGAVLGVITFGVTTAISALASWATGIIQI